VRIELPQIRNFIDGQFAEPIGGKYLDNIEPATGRPYSQVADSDARDLDLAVAAAEMAFVDWSRNRPRNARKFFLASQT
jgi:aminomuconate-semialdehyde/2-hydroxymuconate-6-semialdehyde dehydrogenase